MLLRRVHRFYRFEIRCVLILTIFILKGPVSVKFRTITYKRAGHSTGYVVQERNSWKLSILSEFTGDLIKHAHEYPLSVHRGTAETISRLKTFLCWPKMLKQISDCDFSCDVCKQTIAPNQILRPPIDFGIFAQQKSQVDARVIACHRWE